MNGSDARQVHVSWAGILVLAAATYVAWAVYCFYQSPLRRYPGPVLAGECDTCLITRCMQRTSDCHFSFSAGWTDLWRLYHTLRGDIHLVNRRTHEKYGPVVRTGPNNLDLDLPALIKTIYSADGKWRKTSFYPPASNVADGKVVPNLFSLLDPAEHARQKRPVARHYSLAGVLQLESHFDDAIRLLCHQLEKRYMTQDGEFGAGFDVGQWIKMCMSLLFSKKLSMTDTAWFRRLGCHRPGHI